MQVKDIRDYPTYLTIQNYDLKNGEQIDEILSRDRFYGAGAEENTYAVFDHNRESIFNAGFDLSKVKQIRIPAL